MSPRLSAQQLDHAIKNLETLAASKNLEMRALSQFTENAPVAVIQLLGADPLGQSLRDATEDFFTAKVDRARIELEELELNVKAYRQMRSGLVVPGIRVPG